MGNTIISSLALKKTKTDKKQGVVQSLMGRQLNICVHTSGFWEDFQTGPTTSGELLTLRRHRHSSIPNGCSGTALPEIPTSTRVLHAMEQPSTCARGMTWPHHPTRPPTTSRQLLPNSWADWEGWRAPNPNLIFHLSWVIRGAHRHSIPCKLSILGISQVSTMGSCIPR